ncbi:aminotransferase class V-fold PLP-dependent enzyme [Euzebya sp.]|uniref:aminotransferase class V-fold PLP-dependent enzyme n=1 Tax=Euzebya sp. TaxID=1971409 RepID=UPI0035179D57
MSHLTALAPDRVRPVPGYLNTASVGLGPQASAAAMHAHLDDWVEGRVHPPAFDATVQSLRAAYAGLVGMPSARVAVVGVLSPVAGLVASCLPDGATVLAAEEDFTSVLFPFLADDRLDVRTVPLDGLLDAVTPDVDMIAVSAVQSADGRVLDLDGLATAAGDAGARTFLDLTQAAGWLEVDARRFDVTATSAYKWLLMPRGVGFMTVREDVDWLVPRQAGWYAGGDIWSSIYGPPLRLAADARRFDLSPSWPCVVGALPSAELLGDLGIATIGAHDVGLADAFCEAIDVEPAGSAIVSVDVDVDPAVLEAAGVVAAVRAGRLRLSFHLYNDASDVERAAAVVRAGRR